MKEITLLIPLEAMPSQPESTHGLGHLMREPTVAPEAVAREVVPTDSASDSPPISIRTPSRRQCSTALLHRLPARRSTSHHRLRSSTAIPSYVAFERVARDDEGSRSCAGGDDDPRLRHRGRRCAESIEGVERSSTGSTLRLRLDDVLDSLVDVPSTHDQRLLQYRRRHVCTRQHRVQDIERRHRVRSHPSQTRPPLEIKRRYSSLPFDSFDLVRRSILLPSISIPVLLLSVSKRVPTPLLELFMLIRDRRLIEPFSLLVPHPLSVPLHLVVPSLVVVEAIPTRVSRVRPRESRDLFLERVRFEVPREVRRGREVTRRCQASSCRHAVLGRPEGRGREGPVGLRLMRVDWTS